MSYKEIAEEYWLNNVKKRKKRPFKKGILFFLFFSILAFWWFIYANLTTTSSSSNSSSQWLYFPRDFSFDETIRASLTARGPSNSMDYFPWGYGFRPKPDENNMRYVSSLELHNPAIQNYGPWHPKDEVYSDSQVCTGEDENNNPVPEDCVFIVYRVQWKDPQWRYIRADIKWYELRDKWEWVNIIPYITERAILYKNTDGEERPSANIQWQDRIYVSNDFWEEVIIKTYFGDDFRFWWKSYYNDISKKFAYRVKSSEVVSPGIAKSDASLWWANEKVPSEYLNELNFATIHVKPNGTNKSWYIWVVDKQIGKMRFVTIDMDNELNIGANERTPTPPWLRGFIDVYRWKINPEWWIIMIDRYWNPSTDPIHRVSPGRQAFNKSPYYSGSIPIPATPSHIEHSIWTSRDFLCKQWTIADAEFCVGESWDHPGISQHTVTFEPLDEMTVLTFEAYNIATSNGNAFAFAGDISMYGYDKDQPIDEYLDLFNNYGWETWVIWKTYVEVDNLTGSWAENGFDDDTKETKHDYLHTYKTEICNFSWEMANNVTLELQKSHLTELVWENQWESSFFLNATALDDVVDESKRLNISAFYSQMNVWSLDDTECIFVSYQTKVTSDARSGDIISVKNKFSYNSGDFVETNQVNNPIMASDYDAIVNLIPNPESGSQIYNGDYINYALQIKNTGLSSIPSVKVICPRFLDIDKTECRVWACQEELEILNFWVDEETSVNYSVQTVWVNPWDIIKEQCYVEFNNDDGETLRKDSNEVEHNIIENTTEVEDGYFTLYMDTRSKLLNSPDWEPRPDNADKDHIKYSHRYSGSNQEYMYPENSNPGSYTDSRWRCKPITWPNKPNAVTYNINSSSLSSRNTMSFTSQPVWFQLETTLPSDKPTTILHQGTLSPTHQIPGWEANNWFKNWWTYKLPQDSTIHRAIVNGKDGRINTTIQGTPRLDTWRYVPYDTGKCTYDCRCWKDGCESCSTEYTKYRWQFQGSRDIPFNTSNYRMVTVWGSTAWIETSWGHVHTNQSFVQDGTQANTYNLGEEGFENIVSAPKNYAPTGHSHWDYLISTNGSSPNLISKKWWYVTWKQIKQWHGYHYDRENNPRNYLDDLVKHKLHGKNFEEIQEDTLDKIILQRDGVHYKKWDLTLQNSSWSGVVLVSWSYWTLVVDGDLYIQSDVDYDRSINEKIEDMSYLWVYVTGDIHYSSNVNKTVWSFYAEGTISTWVSPYRLLHYGSLVANAFNFERTAPEKYERSVNESALYIEFDDHIYELTPPGFTELDDWIWSIKYNINQFSWEEVEW